MYKVFLAIGGNLGDRANYLSQMVEQVRSKIGKVNLSSSIYESEPWGFESDQPFLNQVLEVETKLSPLCLLDACQQIEKSLGRDRYTDGYAPRTADIDILFIDNFIFTLPPLVLPHKFLHERLFVLEPLAEIAPDFVHPLLGQSISSIKTQCADKNRVWKYQSYDVKTT
ncbi:MAG: 2-amino-4-hydroxy-6-hydroxymethyldihydropteridine diphosphokinase [Bacteroidales bacterium]